MSVLINGFPTVDLTAMQPDEDIILCLPQGVIVHIERVDHDQKKYQGYRFKGYYSAEDYINDDQRRLSGYEPNRHEFNVKINPSRNGKG